MQEYLVGRAADFPEGGRVAVQVGRRVLAVFRIGGEFFAIHNRCAHKGGSLCDGIVEADRRVVRCPWHHWSWRMEDGRLEAYGQRRMPTYRVRVVGGDVVLEA